MADDHSLPPRTNSSPVADERKLRSAPGNWPAREMASLAPDEATALRLAKTVGSGCGLLGVRTILMRSCSGLGKAAGGFIRF